MTTETDDGGRDVSTANLDLTPFDFSNWEEKIEPERATQAAFGPEGATATLTGMIPWGQEYAAILNLLGYSYTSGAAGSYKLFRKPPATHPRFPWLYATRVQSEPIKPISKQTTNARIKAYATYTLAKLTVSFEALRWVAVPASQNYAETDRYLSFDVEPGEEVITAQTGQLLFAEGTPAGTAFPGTVSLIAPKSIYAYTWHQVPLDWALNPSRVFVQGEALTGKVNSADFLGHPAGTLLYRAPRITLTPSPIAPQATRDVPFYLTIQFRFQRFDPEKGVGASAYRGHNLAPFRGDFKYYYATSDGTTGGRPIYQSGDFSKLFKHWSE